MSQLDQLLDRPAPEAPAHGLRAAPDARWIDAALLRGTTWQWKNAAVLVAAIVAEVPAEAGVLDSALVVGRIGTLLRARRLELRGDLGQLRHCEVRLPLR